MIERTPELLRSIVTFADFFATAMEPERAHIGDANALCIVR